MPDIEILTLLLLVASGFVATNLDNLVLMVVLLGAQPDKRAAVTLGFVASSISVLGISALGAVLGANLDPGWIGYMGLVPLLLGVFLLFRLFRRKNNEAARDAQPPLDSQASGVLATFFVMLSNSADSVAVFFPLLAESDRDSLLWEISAFLVMVIVWAAIGWMISGQPAVAGRIERIGEKLVPWIMIAAGTYILLDTGTDTYIRPV